MCPCDAGEYRVIYLTNPDGTTYPVCGKYM